MVFHSPNFIIFFLALLVPYYLFKKSRIPLLAVANVIFYAFSGLGMLAVFITMTVITFITVHIMRRERWQWFFWVGILANALNLIFFKYTGFLLHTAESWTGLRLLTENSFVSDIVLPVGISFYTFQLISYIIDVRRGQTTPTKSLMEFWVYISLFPQLVAGPIMRGDELIPQLDTIHEKTVRWNEIRYGIYLFFIGFMKKVLFADTIAQMVNPLFAQGDAITPVQSWLAAYGFGFQIYFDFSAYSDMALGLGYILGIQLIINFASPYISADPREFWKRWHISLSRWIKDYIYIGLGGNRRGKGRTYINLFAAMLLSGLWHGAMWTFVLWGGIHGLLVVLHKWSLKLNRWPWIEKVRRLPIYRAMAVLVFFHVITWTWVFFRAQSIDQAWDMSWKMLHVNWLSLLQEPAMIWIGALYALHWFEYAIRNYEETSSRAWHYIPSLVRGAVYLTLVLIVMYFMKGETYDFIYFQF